VGTSVAPAPGLALRRIGALGGPRAAAAEVAGTLRARMGGARAGLRARMSGS